MVRKKSPSQLNTQHVRINRGDYTYLKDLSFRMKRTMAEVVHEMIRCQTLSGSTKEHYLDKALADLTEAQHEGEGVREAYDTLTGLYGQVREARDRWKQSSENAQERLNYIMEGRDELCAWLSLVEDDNVKLLTDLEAIVGPVREYLKQGVILVPSPEHPTLNQIWRAAEALLKREEAQENKAPETTTSPEEQLMQLASRCTVEIVSGRVQWSCPDEMCSDAIQLLLSRGVSVVSSLPDSHSISADTLLEVLGGSLSSRALNSLARKGITTFGEVCRRSDDELLGLRDFGEVSLAEVRKLCGQVRRR